MPKHVDQVFSNGGMIIIMIMASCQYILAMISVIFLSCILFGVVFIPEKTAIIFRRRGFLGCKGLLREGNMR